MFVPGEILTVTDQGLSSDCSLCQEKTARCVFEYIYFARLDSTLDGVSVYDARIRAGAALARSYPALADLVCGRAGLRDPCRQRFLGSLRDSLRFCLL